MRGIILFPGGGSIGVILVNMIICLLNKMTMRKSLASLECTYVPHSLKLGMVSDLLFQ